MIKKPTTADKIPKELNEAQTKNKAFIFNALLHLQICGHKDVRALHAMNLKLLFSAI